MVAAAKAWNLGPAFWFPMKAAMAFPLNYHYLNGIRHLVRIILCFGVLLENRNHATRKHNVVNPVEQHLKVIFKSLLKTELF